MNPTQEQLIAYFSGKAAGTEKEWIGTWLSDKPDNRLVEESIRQVMELLPEPSIKAGEIPAGVLLAHERFQELIRRDSLNKQGTAPLQPRRTYFPYAARIAAVFFLVLAGAGLLQHYLAPADRHGAAASANTVFHAPAATITRITLEDGSVVRLFPGATLTLNPDFNRKERRTALEGRGYFEVAQDPGKPFYVQTGTVTTTVVGTAFEVNTTGKGLASVIVKEGKVNVSAKANLSEKTVLLSALVPGQSITVDQASGAFRVQPVDAVAACNWIRGEIDFRQVPLREILHTLEEWYGVSFIVQIPRLADKKITFFIRRQTLKESMEILAGAGGFRYTIDRNKILIQ